MVGRVLGTTAIALPALLFSSAALSAEPAVPEAGAGASGDEQDIPRGRPLPRDDRTGHVSAFAGIAVVVPAGDLGAGAPPVSTTSTTRNGITLAQVLGTGIGGEAGLVLGVSRHSGLELRGQFVRFAAADDCARAYDRITDKGAHTDGVPTCQSQMFAAGLGWTYHTSQALGFDPWVRFGAGYRALVVGGPLLDISATAPKAGTFHGVDVADFTLGGDYFPAPWLGIGLFLNGVVGVDVQAPSVDARGAVYGLFQAGLRIVVEPQRKAVNAASTPAHPTTALAERLDFPQALYNRAAQ
jgi:hypothetical protein